MASTGPRSSRWLKLSGEAVLIVGSILIAFAIDAWWAERQEAQGLESTLAGIAGGLVESQAAIEQHIGMVSAGADRLQSFLAMDVAEAGRVPGAEAGEYLEPIQRPYTQDNNLTFLRLAVDDEALKGLEDAEIQRALVEWREAINQLDEIDRALSDHWLEALAALGAHEAVGRALGTLESMADSRVLASVRADPAVFALAARKGVLMDLQLTFLPQLVDVQATLLSAIEEQLRR